MGGAAVDPLQYVGGNPRMMPKPLFIGHDRDRDANVALNTSRSWWQLVKFNFGASVCSDN